MTNGSGFITAGCAPAGNALRPVGRALRALTISALFFALGAPLAHAQTSDQSDQPVAVIEGTPVSGQEYQEYLTTYVRSQLYHGGSPDRVRQLAEEALDNLIMERLLTAAADKRGIKGDRKLAKERVEALEKQYKDSPTWDEVKDRLPLVERAIMIDTQIEALKEDVSKVGTPAEADVRAFYEKNLALFTEPSSWDLDLVLIGVPPSSTAREWVEAKEKAEAIHADLEGGADFGSIAERNSSHGSSANKGSLGRVHRGQLPPEADAVVEKLSAGEISEPLRVLEGYAIFRMNEEIPEKRHAFEDVRERAEQLYMRETAVQQWADYRENLRAEADVEVFDISAYVQQLVHKL